jgi:hypothetical protein
MNRVLRPGGTMLVVDQLAPIDSLAAIELNRFERARDPSTTRILADVDLRGFFEANGLVLRQAEIVRENRDLERYLDLAGCHGDERERPVAAARVVAEGHPPTLQPSNPARSRRGFGFSASLAPPRTARVEIRASPLSMPDPPE